MARQARIHVRPEPVSRPGNIGLQPLQVGSVRDSYLYVPPSYRMEKPSPLVVLLHGSGGHAHHGLDLLMSHADDERLILVAPASTSYTWDVIVGRYGPDVAIVDRALEQVFGAYAIDSSHVAVGGFSDGASYALSLGLTNGDLFTHIIAFSPGFVMPPTERDKPRIFISHGTRDEILPISNCSRRIVPRLERAGYEVEYHEFDAGHRIPPDIAKRAMQWFLGKGTS